MAQNKTDKLALYTFELTKSFQQWDDLYHNGGRDPFHADGMNLNLVRNHIMHYKQQIEDLLKDEHETTFFSTPYPDIYFKPTPKEVSYDYMAKADELRKRASEQLALYQKDSNFIYILDHFDEVFSHGETKATRAAGLYPGAFSSYVWMERIIESDNLVDIRRTFFRSYEENAEYLAERAQKLRTFLETDHSLEDTISLTPSFDDDTGEALIEEFEASDEVSAVVHEPTSKMSLDEQIQSAQSRASATYQEKKYREEQLSLF